MKKVKKNLGVIDNKHAYFLMFLCLAVYSFAYVGKLNYTASIVEVIATTGCTKAAAGVVSSCFFFAYGIGQFVNGILSKRYNTKYSVLLALVLSCIINFSMGFVKDISVMKYLWFFNGLSQSILWSSLIKTLSLYLPAQLLSKSVVVMSPSVAIGTIMAYGLASLLAKLQIRWTLIFDIAALVLAVIAVIWFIGMSKIERFEKIGLADTQTSKTKDGEKKKIKFTPVAAVTCAILLLSAIANGFIKDGVTSWVPSILTEDFGVPSSFSIIITVVLPLLSIFASVIVTNMQRKVSNTSLLDGIFFAITVVMMICGITTLKFKSVPLTLAFFGVIACMASCINNVITSLIPLYHRKEIDSGLLAGVINSFCYVGSTLSISILGSVADKSGWTSVLDVIMIVSVIAVVICLVGFFISRNRKVSSDEEK